MKFRLLKVNVFLDSVRENKGVSDLKHCLDYCEDPARSCENLNWLRRGWTYTFLRGCLIFLSSASFNTQYMTNLTIVSPVKLEYGWNFSISGLKMMVKSGLEKIFLKFLLALTMSFLLLNLYFWSTPPFYEVNSFNRKWWGHGGISKIFF